MTYTLAAWTFVPLASSVFAWLAMPSAAAQGTLWLRQFGTPTKDALNAAASDGVGGAYVVGNTLGSLGAANAGSFDVWIARYDDTGSQVWLRQFGGADDDLGDRLAQSAAGVFACGSTMGDLGAVNAGQQDAWLASFDVDGNPLWLRQLGTVHIDQALAVTQDGAGGAFVGGSTLGHLGGMNPAYGWNTDAWLAHYDSTGTQTWIVQLGSQLDDSAEALCFDGAGGVYVAGTTDNDLGATNKGAFDAWLAHYDAAGTQTWIQQFGTSTYDYANALSESASGGVFVAGSSGGSLGGPSAGTIDAWVARCDSLGQIQWLRQLGTSGPEFLGALAPDGAGGVFVSGTTGGSLAASNEGAYDAWLARYDDAGNLVLTKQLGTHTFDYAYAAAADGAGGVFVGGKTSGSLAGPSSGDDDAWLIRFGECGSSAAYCVASGSSLAGCAASLTSSGSPSLGNPGAFAIHSGPVPGGNLGLCLFGANGPAQTPFGTLGGALCVKAPFFRTAPKPGGGTIAQCNGAFAFTLQDLDNASPSVTPGAVLHAQVWSRDPANPDGFLLSNGLQIALCP